VAGLRYIADAETCFRSVELEGLTALFHVRSGMTHILAPPAPQILRALAGRSAELDELAQRLGEIFEVEGEQCALEARLLELEAAGLVTRI
jgi:PqqD family protein of HPr-rel-A system